VGYPPAEQVRVHWEEQGTTWALSLQVRLHRPWSSTLIHSQLPRTYEEGLVVFNADIEADANIAYRARGNIGLQENVVAHEGRELQDGVAPLGVGGGGDAGE